MKQRRWDIFCKVIDNYGDIGVCWRLARQLAAEHGLTVRLWVDDLASFQPLCPALDPALSCQSLQGVDIHHWPADFTVPRHDGMADVVIEAFACDLPSDYLIAMAATRTRTGKQPVWINLEYLSAEAWTQGCHGLPSPHPQLPLTKYFFFPGFDVRSGGLLREARLRIERDAWLHTRPPASHPVNLPARPPAPLTISLFCYENPCLPALLQAWAGGDRPVHCLVPQGRALVQAAAALGQPELQPPDQLHCGSLSLQALPFVRQEDYDPLLWRCDVNFVRGEDSFVRALWAGRPLVWQLYPQEGDAHLPKLQAFLDHYLSAPETTLPAPAAAALRRFWQLWNSATHESIATAWQEYAACLPDYAVHAGNWEKQQANQTDLASKLVFFCEKLL